MSKNRIAEETTTGDGHIIRRMPPDILQPAKTFATEDDGKRLTAPKSIFLLEAEAVEMTLKLWLGLGPNSANRVAALANNHLQEHLERLKQAKP